MTLDRRQTVVLESVRRFLRRSAFGHLMNLMAKTRPQDFAPIFRALTDREQLSAFRALADRDQELGAEFLVELQRGEGVTMLRRLGPAGAAALLNRCADDDAASLLAELEPEESAAVLEAMKPEEKSSVEQLLVYEEETAGRIMTPDVFSLHESMTVSEAIAALQAVADVEMAFYLYIVDDRGHLVGVLSLRELLMHPPTTTLSSIMNTDLLSVQTDTDQEEVAQMAAKYDLLAIPVLDDQGHLAGMVTIDDVVDVLREEATEDIFKMAGTSEEERHEPSIIKSARIRTPWLMATFVGGVLAAFVIESRVESMQTLPLLAAFLPVVLGMGGSAGNQSATVLIRGIATGRIHEGLFARTILREIGVAALLGLLYGTLIGMFSVGIEMYRGATPGAQELILAGVIGLSLASSMVLATIVGSAFPWLLEKLGIDPAVSATPFVTTATDVLGSLVYIMLAYWLLLT